MKKENHFSEFWIGSFDIEKEEHMNIFNELMLYQDIMSPKNQFEILDKKYFEMYFEEEKK